MTGRRLTAVESVELPALLAGRPPRAARRRATRLLEQVGLAAGIIAIPAGIALHQFLTPVMGHAARTSLPAGVLSVYQPRELVLLALAGLVTAVAGASGSATRIAWTRTAAALRSE